MIQIKSRAIGLPAVDYARGMGLIQQGDVHSGGDPDRSA